MISSKGLGVSKRTSGRDREIEIGRKIERLYERQKISSKFRIDRKFPALSLFAHRSSFLILSRGGLRRAFSCLINAQSVSRALSTFSFSSIRKIFKIIFVLCKFFTERFSTILSRFRKINPILIIVRNTRSSLFPSNNNLESACKPLCVKFNTD